MQSNSNITYEQHPLFPSGEWEGFYTYKAYGNQKFNMACTLEFQNGKITGSGSDDIGAFEWKGVYSTQAETCTMIKHDVGRHHVFYDGTADENGIWGSWKISPIWTGGFHIWPKQISTDEKALMSRIEAITQVVGNPNL